MQTKLINYHQFILESSLNIVNYKIKEFSELMQTNSNYIFQFIELITLLFHLKCLLCKACTID